MLFFFNDTATTEIYTLSLHDALPIWRPRMARHAPLPDRRRASPQCAGEGRPRPGRRGGQAGLRLAPRAARDVFPRRRPLDPDRKSTRLNSSHANTSYAVFCLKTTTHT